MVEIPFEMTGLLYVSGGQPKQIIKAWRTITLYLLTLHFSRRARRPHRQQRVMDEKHVTEQSTVQTSEGHVTRTYKNIKTVVRKSLLKST